MAGATGDGMKFFSTSAKRRTRYQVAGDQGEYQAEIYLKKQGMKVVDRNFSCRWGELDLIMRDGDTLVIVEVRRRATTDYGSAQDTVTLSKQKKVIRATKFYQQQADWWGDVRFDVVAVTAKGENDPEVEHVVGAFFV